MDTATLGDSSKKDQKDGHRYMTVQEKKERKNREYEEWAKLTHSAHPVEVWEKKGAVLKRQSAAATKESSLWFFHAFAQFSITYTIVAE